MWSMTMQQFDIKQMLLKIAELETQETIDYLVEIVTKKKEDEFLEIATKNPPQTREQLKEILNKIM